MSSSFKAPLKTTIEASTGRAILWEQELKRRFSSTSFIPLKPGSLLAADKLTIERQLSFGGFSAVYLARNADGEVVVVKELAIADQSKSGATKARELFKREADLLRQLDHPQVVKVLDCFTEKDREYIVLEHISGKNLRQFIRTTQTFDSAGTLSLALQMASILEYLHSRDTPVIHRDFTPDNLVIDEDGRLVLIDFGAANEYMGSATGTLVGKQCYMPPEQIRGKSTPQSDLFALGATLYFLLTAEEPEALKSSRPSSRIDDIWPELDDLIARLTHLDLSSRPADAGEVLRELEAARHAELLLQGSDDGHERAAEELYGRG